MTLSYLEKGYVGLAKIKYLDDISDRNLVWFFRGELNGMSLGYTILFSYVDSKRLKRHEIIIHNHLEARFILTSKGRIILDSLNSAKCKRETELPQTR